MTNTIFTKISPDHTAMLEIFIKATELNDMKIVPYTHHAYGVDHTCLSFVCDNEDTMSQTSFMSIKHGGVENMLYSYLMLVGAAHNDIEPQSILRAKIAETARNSTISLLKTVYGDAYEQFLDIKQ